MQAPRFATGELEQRGVQEGEPQSAFAAWEALRGGFPAVLRNTPLVAGLLERWTQPYLVG